LVGRIDLMRFNVSGSAWPSTLAFWLSDPEHFAQACYVGAWTDENDDKTAEPGELTPFDSGG
jgi:hypothetical protein